MPAPLSIIIPTLNAEAEIQACMASLGAGLTASLIREVIIADGGSTDQTILPAFEAGARILKGPAGRGRQLRTGARNAKGDWFLFLHADTQLESNWPDVVWSHIQSAPDCAGAFQLAYRSDATEARWLEKRANKRARVLGLPYGDQGLLISRKLYQELGGYSDQPLMEDVDLVRRIGKNQLKHLSARAFTSAHKYERDGWRKRAYKNAFLLLRYYLGASPEKLAKAYR